LQQQSGSVDQLRGAWVVGEPRTIAVEDQLTALVASAPQDADRLRAERLRDAVRLSRSRIGELLTGVAVDPRDLGAVAADLSTALAVETSPFA
jgi:hypothetical protein